jgi:hypothetical protein
LRVRILTVPVGPLKQSLDLEAIFRPLIQVFQLS